MALKKLITLRNVVDAKPERVPFNGEWQEAFGNPQATGAWFIWGRSGSGKTAFVLKLIGQLALEKKVLFVSYEEGTVSVSLQEGIKRYGLLNVNSNVWICTDTVEELDKRLNRRRSASVVVIDSLERSEIRKVSQLADLSTKFPDKLFVVIGQAEGKLPVGRLGHDVLHAANQKIYVEGFRAYSRGRSMGTAEYFTIWQHGAELYWSDTNNN
jgi:hypothetical protein